MYGKRMGVSLNFPIKERRGAKQEGYFKYCRLLELRVHSVAIPGMRQFEMCPLLKVRLLRCCCIFTLLLRTAIFYP